MRLTCRSVVRGGAGVLVSTMILLSNMVFISTTAHAEEQVASGDVARDQLAKVIAVLRIQPAAAGQSCLDALHEVHQTEDQVKILQNKANNPDLALAQDVLETDYENAKEICGADADRICVAKDRVKEMDASCTVLHRGSKGR